jgi:hypothetical protein
MMSKATTPESRLLQSVQIRLIEDHERAEFDRRLEQDHYLHQPLVVGPTLRYLAELDGQPVALLLFSSAALHIKARDKWIGWTARQRTRRLGLVVNNARFLVFPDRQKLPNLASRVLGLALKRLSDDWLEHHGNPVLVVESFVDETRFRGTCYKACGFEAVGATAGFSRASRDFYIEHDRPKQLFVRALCPRGRQLLRQSRLPADLAEYEAAVAGPCPLRATSLGSLSQRFRALGGHRPGHGRYHRQYWVLATAAVCTLMGGTGFRDFEAISAKFTQRQLQALGVLPDTQGRRRSPSDSTFRRVINACDVRQFVAIVGQWLLEQEPAAIARLALDGKTLRGSGRKDGRALQIFSAVTHHLRLTLQEVPIEEKTNEIPNFKTLLRAVKPPPGTLVTADAMHCQQESARCVVEEFGGDYLFGLKGNQDGILDRAERLLAQQSFPPSGPESLGKTPRPA